MIRIFFALLLSLIVLDFSAQAQIEESKFTKKTVLEHTPVISQGNTGTCWSFATTSFIESEIMRKGFPQTDLSEMFFVYHAYQNKSKSYLLYQGNNNFSQGGQAHDVINVLRDEGMVTDEAFPGVKTDGKFRHNHLARDLFLEVEKFNKITDNFHLEFIKKTTSLLREHLGKLPKKVKTAEGKYTPQAFRDKFDIHPDDYVELTSFNHHPFYKPFVLEIPDNWAHGLYYNVPIDELVQVMTYALDNGHTVCWDGDTSEKSFRHEDGIADIPDNQKRKIDQESRQETFFDRTTTDDHLMHIVGLYEDAQGKPAFFTKNSWGAESNKIGGYLILTYSYVRLKTIAIMVHKEAIPPMIRQKLKI
ncbi:MAG: C1 family peptidase [Mariniphaga sp.]